MSLKFGINFAMTRKLLTPLAVVGGGASWIALTFFGSGDIPFDENTNPKKVIVELTLFSV